MILVFVRAEVCRLEVGVRFWVHCFDSGLRFDRIGDESGLTSLDRADKNIHLILAKKKHSIVSSFR